MRKTFAPLDDVLIERLFQPMVDLVVQRIGFCRSAVACLCLDLAALSWIVSRAGGLSNAVAGWDAVGAFFDLAFLLLGLAALISLRTLFRKARGNLGNPLRAAMRPHRAIVLLMLASQLIQPQAPGMTDVADIAMLAFAAAALYLGACTERPPVRRSWTALAAVN
jgi:hypothetical protein